MQRTTGKPTLRERVRWYPVTTVGWLVTGIYTALLLYVIVETNRDLYSVNQALFRATMIISGMVVLILLYARYTGEKPFCAKK